MMTDDDGRHARILTRARGLWALAVPALFLAACAEPGPGTEEAADTAAMDTATAAPTPAPANEVEVTLTDFEIDMPATLPPGPTTFRVANEGAVEHNFEVEGQGIEREFEENLAAGDTRTLQVDLQPGTYEIYCPVADHAERGMRMELTVQARGGP